MNSQTIRIIKNKKRLNNVIAIEAQKAAGEKKVVYVIKSNLLQDCNRLDNLHVIHHSFLSRRSPRLEYTASCEISIPHIPGVPQVIAEIEDISLTGMKIRNVSFNVEKGFNVNCLFRLPETTEDFEVEAEIVHVHNGEAGLKFHANRKQQKQITQSIINYMFSHREMLQKDRRSSFRFPLELPCRISLDHMNTIPGTITNISASGLALHGIPPEYANGVDICIAVSLEKEEVLINGQIVWNKTGTAGIQFYDELESPIENLLHDSLISNMEFSKLLYDAIENKLPFHSVPDYFYIADSFPVNRSGRINKTALRKLVTRYTREEEKPEEYYQDEKIVRDLWLKILHESPDGSSPFSLFISQLPGELLDKYPFLKILKSGYHDDLLHPEKHQHIHHHYFPLSHPQKRIWYSEKIYPASGIGNLFHSCRFSGEVDCELLKKAIGFVIQDNPVLRLHITTTNNAPVQYTAEYHPPIIDHLDFNYPGGAGKYNKWMKKITAAPLFKENSPLYRFTVITFPDGKTGFFFGIHHTLTDETGIAIIIQRIRHAYDTLSAKKIPTSKNNEKYDSFPYAEYIHYEDEYKNSEKYAADEEFWIEKLKDYTEPAFIKQFDHITDVRAKRKEYCIPWKLENKIREFCAAERTSLFRIFLGVLYIYINRITGKNDIVVGSAFHNRFRDTFKQMIGMLASTTPFRIHPANDVLSFKTLLGYIKDEIREIKNHQEYPYDVLMDTLNTVNSDYKKHFIFDILLNYHNMNFALDTTWHFHGSGNFPLTINLSHRGENGKMKLEIDYQTHLFTDSEIDQFYHHLIQLVTNAIYDPDKNIFELEMITEKEKHRILFEFNNTYTEYPRDKTIYQLFKEQVDRTPDNVAVVCNGKSLTYSELSRKADHIACILRDMNVKHNSFIGIMLNRSIEMIAGILGILKAGCAYAPVDLKYPKDRIEYMINDSHAEIIITTSEFIQRIDYNGTYVLLDDLPSIQTNENDYFSAGTPMDLAYIMYTSGSTGLPKGVMVRQKSVVRLVKNTRYMEFTEDDRILQTGSPVFDASTLEIWGSLLNGGSLYLVNEESILDVNELRKALTQYKITILWLTSALFSQLALIRPEMFSGLKYLLVGGDVLNPECINTVNKICKNTKILNGYGPTENTTFSTTFFIDKEYKENIPIGSPISNSTAYIVNKFNKLQPTGIPGELVVGGDGLAAGYLNRPGLTAEKFIANPFVPGEKMYKTGDLARWLPDGNIEFLGRIDHQVKIRGFRIELGEIEAVIREDPHIIDAVVLAGSNGHGDKKLTAYIVSEIFRSLGCYMETKDGKMHTVLIHDIPSTETIITDRIHTDGPGTGVTLLMSFSHNDNVSIEGTVLWESQQYMGVQLHNMDNDHYQTCVTETIQKRTTLISRLVKDTRDRLPNYMIPSHFLLVDSIPLTSNGKINRKALHSITIPAEDRKKYTAPRNEIQSRLLEIWKNILKIDTIGIDENFFDIGGNSLKLITLKSELKKSFHKEIPIVKLFQYTSIKAIADTLLQSEDERENHHKPEINSEVHKHEVKDTGSTEIAVIGLSGRFPGAKNIEEFWNNLVQGKESISFFSDKELMDAGVDPEFIKQPHYVKAKGKLEDIEYFDEEFFGYSKKDTIVMDPQVRIFHEVVYTALEAAGYVPHHYRGSIGLFAGASENYYWQHMLYAENNKFVEQFPMLILNKNFLSTRIAYTLDLKGPAYTISTACSTSLVAVDMAVRALLENDCEIAVAGGVSLRLPKESGYFYNEGFTLSPDGHCRAFDADAQGMVMGEGAGVIVLKRMDKALKDRDHIWAVIKGSATNNDGSDKIGYTAPSITGQAEVIKKAIERAGINPETISYVETHGTGTALGDTVEIEGLKAAFQTGKRHFCRIGSVKTNIGHLDAAAGIAGMIKTILMLTYKKIPPILHFHTPNPKIDFTDSPFVVNDRLIEWEKNGDFPLRAGVSAFGIGGTNAHVILEEASPGILLEEDDSSHDRDKLIVMSANSSSILDEMSKNLYKYLEKNPGINLDDVAYTLQTGRGSFHCRKAIVCKTNEELKNALCGLQDNHIFTGKIDENTGSMEKKIERAGEILHLIKDKSEGASELCELAQLWCDGVSVHWQELYDTGRRRVPLPGYPFRKHYFSIRESEKFFKKHGVFNTHSRREEEIIVKGNNEKELMDIYSLSMEEITHIISDIWEEFFGRNGIGEEEDFFDLGGDSMLAIQIVMEINKRLHINVLSHTFLQSPTIRGTADRIQSIISSSDSLKRHRETHDHSLILLKDGCQTDFPLFLIHPASGTVYFYHDLCLSLTGEQQVYGIEAQGVHDIKPLLTDVRKMASRYISLIRQVQPEGPYYIGGSSLGGCIAYEMGLQLQKQKEGVGSIFMIDTPGPTSDIPDYTSDAEVLAYFLTYDGEHYQDTLSLLNRMTEKERFTYFLNKKSVYKQTLYSKDSMEKLKKSVHLTLTNLKAMRHYYSHLSSSYPGRVIYFSATGASQLSAHLYNDWKDYLKGESHVYKIDGNHITINLSPAVKEIADYIQRYLPAGTSDKSYPQEGVTGG